jgi:hypothetical protein
MRSGNVAASGREQSGITGKTDRAEDIPTMRDVINPGYQTAPSWKRVFTAGKIAT